MGEEERGAPEVGGEMAERLIRREFVTGPVDCFGETGLSRAVRGPGKAAGSTPSRDRARVRGPIARDLWGAQPSATRSSPGPCPEGRATASSRREPPAVAGTWPVRTRAWRSCCTDGDFTILSLAGARRPVSFGFYGVGSVVCEHGTLHALARIEVHLGSAMVVPRPWTGRRRCS